MNKLTVDKALSLLLKDVIYKKEDLEESKNRWVKHCIYVGIAAGRIAERIGLDSDLAVALGYIHDIGRKISHANHTIAGFEYMIGEGYEEEARICLTHSFIDNNIYYTAGGVPEPKDRYDYMNNYLINTSATLYDNIIQMCDLFCLETGFTTIEKRMLDISRRKGIYSNSRDHFDKVMELKSRLESIMGCSLYDLFPEISLEDKDNIDKDHEAIMKIFNKYDVNNEGPLLTKKDHVDK